MYTMHLLPSVTIQPNLELKTGPKQLLGSLPLVIALPRLSYEINTATKQLFILDVYASSRNGEALNREEQFVHPVEIF